MEDRRYDNPQEELLARILDECMEEQLSFVPPEREISHTHKFSPEFQKRMEEILKSHGKPAGRKLEKKEFIYGFNKAAACILVLLVIGAVGGIGYLGFGMPASKNAPQENSTVDMEAAPAEESAASLETETGESMDTGEWESSENQEGGSLETDEVIADHPRISQAEFMGQTLNPAPEQRLPARLGQVKTLVNSPMISRDAEEIMLTIGNMEEYTIYYYQCMDLEVLIDGYWYVVPPLTAPTEEESRQMVSLEPGMAQDEAIRLDNYTLDYEAQEYRLVTYMDNMTLCARFRFEEEELFGEEE